MQSDSQTLQPLIDQVPQQTHCHRVNVVNLLCQGDTHEVWVAAWAHVCSMLVLLGRLGICGSPGEDAVLQLPVLAICAITR